MPSLQTSRSPVLSMLVAVASLALAIAAPRPVAAQGTVPSVTVDLEEVGDSNISGRAILTAAGNQTIVDMTLTGSGLRGDHPTHIHTGTCDNFDPNPLYPLETVVLQAVNRDGTSVSTVDVPLAELQRGDYVILVHHSREQLTTYLVCGGIPRVDGTTVSTMPAAGSGAVAPPATLTLVVALAVGAGLLCVAGLTARVRR